MLSFSPSAHAGMIVGTGGGNGGNDTIGDVMDVIDDYNANNDPALSTDIMFLAKSDEVSFDYGMGSDFMFFEDADGLNAVTSASELTSLDMAYFKYTGEENLLFYSVKGPSQAGFTLYTYMPVMLNLMDLSNSSAEISHVSFWKGPGGIDPFGNSIPEPSALALLGTILAAARGYRRLA
ncbi:hypothetical protein [Aeoliella straminimaris]|nr:hypothetical protein [Aeoliella straminimaris]